MPNDSPISNEHPAASIIFSRVKLWADTGEEYEFFMGGAPEDYEDLEDQEGCFVFKEFLEQTPGANLEGIIAFITTFSEGDGECVPASDEDIERIYTAVAEVDIDTITGWNKVGENTLFFDFDTDETLAMGGIE